MITKDLSAWEAVDKYIKQTNQRWKSLNGVCVCVYLNIFKLER